MIILPVNRQRYALFDFAIEVYSGFSPSGNVQAQQLTSTTPLIPRIPKAVGFPIALVYFTALPLVTYLRPMSVSSPTRCGLLNVPLPLCRIDLV